ncbi:hypothetical protein XELAEV_18012523mg [Xenopus laevis]|uniref:GIY-YIG domain-containing protein n=1 Tax=Xenopus laevis TaxID=8355 RepID=A0A974DQH3_XENLA|nr:hypothetical protein XELAEV_18012523mg [Xenopus laevis]
MADLCSRILSHIMRVVCPKNRTLGSMLVRSDLGGKQMRQGVLRPKNNGTFPCLSCNCCSNCQKGDTVYHPLYIVKCPCGYLYVGQTTRMIRERIRERTLLEGQLRLGSAAKVQQIGLLVGVWI